MGYSCTFKAGHSLDAIMAALCTGESSNVFEHKDVRYFIERSRENDDGAVTGSIYRFDDCRKAGGLRIEPDGTITRPVYMRDAAYREGFIKISSRSGFPLSEILPLVEIEIKKAFRKKPFRTKAK